MKSTSLNEIIYNLLCKHDAPGVSRKHTADVIAQHVQYHVHEQNTYHTEKESWEALSQLCKQAKVSVLVLDDGSFNIMDSQTELQTTVGSKEGVIAILQARLEYFVKVSGYDWV